MVFEIVLLLAKILQSKTVIDSSFSSESAHLTIYNVDSTYAPAYIFSIETLI